MHALTSVYAAAESLPLPAGSAGSQHRTATRPHDGGREGPPLVEGSTASTCFAQPCYLVGITPDAQRQRPLLSLDLRPPRSCLARPRQLSSPRVCRQALEAAAGGLRQRRCAAARLLHTASWRLSPSTSCGRPSWLCLPPPHRPPAALPAVCSPIVACLPCSSLPAHRPSPHHGGPLAHQCNGRGTRAGRHCELHPRLLRHPLQRHQRQRGGAVRHHHSALRCGCECTAGFNCAGFICATCFSAESCPPRCRKLK